MVNAVSTFFVGTCSDCLSNAGTAAYTGIHPELLQAVSKGLFTGLESLITSKVELNDVVQKGILALLNHKDSESKQFSCN